MVLWGYYCQWCATLSGFEEFVRALICGEKAVGYPCEWYGYPSHPSCVDDIQHAWYPIFICPCFFYIGNVLLAGDSSTKEIMLDGLGFKVPSLWARGIDKRFLATICCEGSDLWMRTAPDLYADGRLLFWEFCQEHHTCRFCRSACL